MQKSGERKRESESVGCVERPVAWKKKQKNVEQLHSLQLFYKTNNINDNLLVT